MSTSRRGFLQLLPGLAALAAGAALDRARAAAARPGRLSLGHSLYGMQTIPLAEAVAHCARIGFRNVELVLDPGSPADPAQLSRDARRDLRARLADLGLEVSALMRNLRLIGGLTPEENRAALEAAAGLAHDLAPDRPPPIETTLGGSPAEWEDVRARMAAGLSAWAATAEASGIELVVKAHMTMAVDSPAKLLWLLEQVSSRRLHAAFDYSHFQARGFTLESSWETLGARTKFVHVKDTGMEDGRAVFLLPGEGNIDYPGFFRLLGETGYSGPVVAEVSSMVFRRPGYDPVATAEKCHRFLSQAVAKAGMA